MDAERRQLFLRLLRICQEIVYRLDNYSPLRRRDITGPIMEARDISNNLEWEWNPPFQVLNHYGEDITKPTIQEIIINDPLRSGLERFPLFRIDLRARRREPLTVTELWKHEDVGRMKRVMESWVRHLQGIIDVGREENLLNQEPVHPPLTPEDVSILSALREARNRPLQQFQIVQAVAKLARSSKRRLVSVSVKTVSSRIKELKKNELIALPPGTKGRKGFSITPLGLASLQGAETSCQ